MKERLKVEHLSVSFFTDEGEVQAAAMIKMRIYFKRRMFSGPELVKILLFCVILSTKWSFFMKGSSL